MKKKPLLVSGIILAIIVVAGILIIVPGLVTGSSAGHARSSKLSVLSGNVLIMHPGQSQWTPAKDGILVSPGDVVRTEKASRALVTFFEGSTIDIEPDSELTITDPGTRGQGESATMSVSQKVGTTWHRVENLIDSGSSYKVETPAGTAMVRGTAFEVTVDPDGTTKSKVAQDTVVFSAQSASESITSGQQNTTRAGSVPGRPSVTPQPANTLLISLESIGAMPLVVDPVGRSTGRVQPGIEVNQIPGALTSNETSLYTITIPDAIPGTYSIIVGAGEDRKAVLSVKGINGTAIALTQTVSSEVKQQGEYLAALTVDSRDGRITGGRLDNMLPLTGVRPGNVVMTQRALGKLYDQAWSGFTRTVNELSNAGKSTEVAVNLPQDEIAGKLGELADGAKVKTDNISCHISGGAIDLSGLVNFGNLPLKVSIVISLNVRDGKLQVSPDRATIGLAPVPSYLVDKGRGAVLEIEQSANSLPIEWITATATGGRVSLTGRTLPRR